MFARIGSLALLVPLLGCGSSESRLSGTVTVDGQPLREGHITFFPTEGCRSVCGAKVTDGKYQVNQIPAGKRRAVISGPPAVQVSNSSRGAPTLKFGPSPHFVSPQAKGNQQVVEILAGKQTLDFKLQNPTASPSR